MTRIRMKKKMKVKLTQMARCQTHLFGAEPENIEGVLGVLQLLVVIDGVDLCQISVLSLSSTPHQP